MARERHSPSTMSMLEPREAEILHVVQENLRLLAELRAGLRSHERGGPSGRQVKGPEDIFDLLQHEMAPLLQEQVRVVLLDTRNRVLDVVLVYQGNVRMAVIRPAEVFRDAMIANAPAVAVVHNHPSGDPEPSQEDLAITKHLAGAGELLGIELVDHVVIGHGDFVSLKRRDVLAA
ncbi:MAG: RadC family protein [Dehalococcoidia bacterium]